MKFTVKSNTSKSDASVTPIHFTERKGVRFISSTDKALVLEMGIGKKFANVTPEYFQKVCRQIILHAKQHQIRRMALDVDALPFPQLRKGEKQELISHIVQDFELANFEFTAFKTKPAKGWSVVEEVLLLSSTDKNAKEGLKRGQLIAGEVNAARVLANTPGGDMTPTTLAQAAKASVKGTSVKVEVLNRAAMKKIGMGGVLGVAQGATEEPKFIIMEYRGGKQSDRPIVLVGKGVTFDTGGLNLKPSDGIYEMHMDMAGGGAVIHAVALAAKLGTKKNVIGLIPAVENAVSGSSYRPGDILTSLSKKTIEVLNTDAEGRIILADALTYAMKYKPQLVIDVATLTGAALVALGQHASAVLTKDRELEQLLRDVGEETGDRVWPLPLWNEYEQYTKGIFADVANIPATGNSRYGGTINGAMFLYQFAKEYPKDVKWAHIDMAPRMTAAPGDHLAKGATGEPVRLLARLVERY